MKKKFFPSFIFYSIVFNCQNYIKILRNLNITFFYEKNGGCGSIFFQKIFSKSTFKNLLSTKDCTKKNSQRKMNI